MVDKDKNLYLKKPFRVTHNNGDVMQGFDDLASAEADAEARNSRAKELGILARYKAHAK